MNIKLIQHNIKQIESLVQQDNPVEAGRGALALAKLILQSHSQDAPRSLYISYAGAAAEMKACFDTLLANYQPGEDAAQLRQKIEEVNEKIQTCAAEAETLAAENQNLISREQELSEQLEELHKLEEKVNGLIQLEEEKIPALQNTIKMLNEKLESLEAESQKALDERAKWMKVFDEDTRLIADLPDSIGDKTADEIIAAAKEFAEKVRQTDEESDEWLRRVIEAVKESRERMKIPEGE